MPRRWGRDGPRPPVRGGTRHRRSGCGQADVPAELDGVEDELEPELELELELCVHPPGIEPDGGVPVWVEPVGGGGRLPEPGEPDDDPLGGAVADVPVEPDVELEPVAAVVVAAVVAPPVVAAVVEVVSANAMALAPASSPPDSTTNPTTCLGRKFISVSPLGHATSA